MDIPKKLTVDDKDYLLQDMNDEAKKFAQDCMASNNVTDSKRLQIEIASIAQAKKLDELGGLLVDVQCFEKQSQVQITIEQVFCLYGSCLICH